MKYDWVNIYQEFANKLLDYKNNRAELIRILQEIYSELNLKYPLIDEDEIGKDVCPFSAMGLFNKQITKENRINILSKIKEKFALNANVPTDFSGIPILNNLSAMFYAFKRGDTIYDVIIPEDAEVIDCPSPSAPHGVFRSNKIILDNPRSVTDEVATELYLKSELPEKSYFKAMAGCCVRGYINTALKIFEDKVNMENIEIAIFEFEDFCKPNEAQCFDENRHLSEYTKIIYGKLKECIK